MDDPAVLPLYLAWSAPDRGSRLAALEGVAAPGPIALRSRYRHLHDPEAPGSRAGSETEDPQATLGRLLH